MDLKEFKARYPLMVEFPNLVGDYHLIIYEDPTDRGHGILARSYEAAKRIYAGLAKKWNYVPEIHGYYPLTVVNPPGAIRHPLLKECFENTKQKLRFNLGYAAEEYFKASGEIPPGFAKCEYQPGEEASSWDKKYHSNCQRCRERTGSWEHATENGLYLIDPEEPMRDRWDELREKIDRDGYERPFGYLDKWVPIKASKSTKDRPVYLVVNDEGHHCKGVVFREVTAKNPTGGLGRRLFYCQTKNPSGKVPKDLNVLYLSEVEARKRESQKEEAKREAERKAEEQKQIWKARSILGIK